MITIKRTAAPATLPISVADVKSFSRVASTSEDAVITRMIKTAVHHVEKQYGLSLITQTWKHYLTAFPGCSVDYEIRLKRRPVSAITSVKYIDIDGAEQTLVANTDYTVDLDSVPPVIVPAYGKSWPTARFQRKAVTVEATHGYGADTAIPEDIQSALLLFISHLYDNRTPTEILKMQTIRDLIGSYQWEVA